MRTFRLDDSAEFFSTRLTFIFDFYLKQNEGTRSRLGFTELNRAQLAKLKNAMRASSYQATSQTENFAITNQSSSL